MNATAVSHGQPDVAGFFDPQTFSIQYVVSDPATNACAIIDPVLDFDEKSGATATRSADALLDHIERKELTPVLIFDTHPHADHFSAAGYLRDRTAAPIATGSAVTEVQKLWKAIYDWPTLADDGRQWDRLFSDGDTFAIGALKARFLHAPGHTLASMTCVIGDAAFVHDTLFQPDFGTARADFPGACAETLWETLQKTLALPDDTRLFTGHDYMPGGREPHWESTVAEQRAHNIHPLGPNDRARYIALRTQRDRTLPMPKLMLHALQVNIAGGRLPAPAANGRRYLKIPLDAF